MLVNTKKMLLDAQENHYAIGAFNVENMEMVMAVITAAEEMNSPVILQTTPSTIRFANVDMYYANMATAAKLAKVPVAVHLDHGNSNDIAMQAFRAGYTSIMIDGSPLSFEENIALTKKVVDVCHSTNVCVEAELGKVGGKEDDLDVKDPGYTNPLEAKQFVEMTYVDSLAVSIGTAHGVYVGEPKLDIERLSQIRELVSIPLVLHGTSGVPDKTVKECVKRGICKVNYATDLRIQFTKGVRSILADEKVYDPKKYTSKGIEEVTNYVKSKILICNSQNKASSS